jgi:ribosomal protein RSM22 (predicted rRNA methylase)
VRRSSRIHRGLTGARELVGAPYLADPGLRREYEAEIAPRTRAALGKILGELYGGAAVAPARALDLGAGTGAAGAALRARFGDGLDLVSVDRVAAPGIVVADLTRDLPATTGRFDVIVAAHLLNELYLAEAPGARIEARARRVLAWCRALLAAGGTFILLEPALRETSRALLAVRDRLIGAGLAVVAPCFWTGPCPALARERDWCHDAAKVPSAPRVDFSYLALRATAPAASSTAYVRVVSDPLVEKGRLRIFGCGPTGRHAFVRLDRAATATNAAFAEFERGDVVTIDAATDAAIHAATDAATDAAQSADVRVNADARVTRRPLRTT